MPYKAFIFDLNGTMIDDMDYHITAWHRILHDLGSEISLQQMKLEAYGKNAEVLERILPGRFSLEEKNHIGLEKEKQYQEEFRPRLKLIHGLRALLDTCQSKGIRMAIGSAAIMFNIDYVLDGTDIRSYIDAIVSADDVTHSKPDAETFLKCAEKLGIAASDCLVFEDSPKGIECAANAGMKAVAITTMHTKDEFAIYTNIIAVIGDYTALAVAGNDAEIFC